LKKINFRNENNESNPQNIIFTMTQEQFDILSENYLTEQQRNDVIIKPLRDGNDDRTPPGTKKPPKKPSGLGG
jgi:hypothetical protein